MPSGEPAAFRILRAVKETIQGISTPTYDTDPQLVEIGEAEWIAQKGLFPCAAIAPGFTDYKAQEESATNKLEGTQRIRVMLIVSTMTDPVEALSKFARDVTEALLTNFRLSVDGSDTVRDTFPTAMEPFFDELEIGPIYGAVLEFEVNFATPRDNLNQSA